MKNRKTFAYEHFDKSNIIDDYVEMYKDIDLEVSYPANLQRLNICISILKKIKPNFIIDAGCGTGQPLLEILKNGFKAKGYDKAENMVNSSKECLKNNGFDSDLVSLDDFEDPIMSYEEVDCIVGLGTFYYSTDIKKTLFKQINKISKNGHIVFSLRNSLFDFCTFNNYSVNAYSKLFRIDDYDQKTQDLFFATMGSYSNFEADNIDLKGVISNTHNPLTVQSDLLSDLGLRLEGIYFYHYHCLPPFLEKIDKLSFRKKSLKIEDPLDWRGNFLASGFIVHAQKK
jgi:SAM-dependent methyltransferase